MNGARAPIVRQQQNLCMPLLICLGFTLILFHIAVCIWCIVNLSKYWTDGNCSNFHSGEFQAWMISYIVVVSGSLNAGSAAAKKVGESMCLLIYFLILNFGWTIWGWSLLTWRSCEALTDSNLVTSGYSMVALSTFYSFVGIVLTISFFE